MARSPITFLPLPFVFAVVSLATLLPGCLGDQLGGSEQGVGWCKDEARHPITWNEKTPLGFRAKDVTAFSVHSFEMPLDWSISEGHTGLTLLPDGGETTLHLAIDPDVASLHYVERKPDTHGRDIAVECPNYLEIETTLSFRTENGAFDEVVPVTLIAEHALAARAAIPLEPGKMTGTFDLRENGSAWFDATESSPPNRIERQRTELLLDFFPNQASATIKSSYNLYFGTGDLEAVGGDEVTLGRSLGEGGCYTEDFTPLLESGEAVSRMSALFDETPRIAFEFDGDLPDTEFEAQFKSSAFCVSTWTANTLSFSIDLTLTGKEDESPFATWPLHGYAVYSKSGELDSLKLFQDSQSPLETMEEATLTWGDFGVDFGDATHASFGVLLSHDKKGWSGELSIRGLSLSDPNTCAPRVDPAGDLYAADCPLLSEEILASAALRQVD